MAQFGVRTVQPIVTLYVQEMVGNLPNVATLAGIAFSITGLANVISAPFLGNRSDRIGYRRVLLVCLAGGTITTLPQAFIDDRATLRGPLTVNISLTSRIYRSQDKKPNDRCGTHGISARSDTARSL